LGAPKSGRSAWLNSGHFAALVKSLNSAEFVGNDVNKAEGLVPRTAGFDVFEQSGADANAENLAGFCFHKSAIVMAARGIDATGAGTAGVELLDIEIPGLGIPVQFRRWYNADAGGLRISAALNYVVGKGTGMGVRIVTA
jgi:hypothetical protein